MESLIPQRLISNHNEFDSKTDEQSSDPSYIYVRRNGRSVNKSTRRKEECFILKDIWVVP